jgi:outer membrane biosynthesis protein TonB
VAPAQLAVGDVVYLRRDGDSYAAGFTLQQQQQQQQQPPQQQPPQQPPQQQPPQQQQLPQPQRLAGHRQSPASNKRRKTAAPAAAPAVAPAAAGAASTAAARQQRGPQVPQLFSGVCLLDWDGRHTRIALQRAQEGGAAVSSWLDGSITHIIARCAACLVCCCRLVCAEERAGSEA